MPPDNQHDCNASEDVEDYIRVLKIVLGDKERYRAAYDDHDMLHRWTWSAQAGVLDEVYQGLLADATIAGSAS